MLPPEIQAASVRRTAIAFGIPYRTLREAVRNSELPAFRSGGSRTVLIWDDVRAWLRDRQAKPRQSTGSPS